MDERTVHELALAYAQAKLLQEQQMVPEKGGCSEEICSFLKWYHFAVIRIPQEDKEIDISTLV